MMARGGWGYRETRQVITKIGGFRSSSLPPQPEDEGLYLLDVDDNSNSSWRQSSEVLLELGETETTAYRGDRGAEAYNHISKTDNPHQVTKDQVGLGNVNNTSDADKPVSTATQTALDGKANVAGSCDATFSVKKATDDCHAVNKKQFDDKIEWLIEQPIDCGDFN
jgi:hypothetical protein